MNHKLVKGLYSLESGEHSLGTFANSVFRGVKRSFFHLVCGFWIDPHQSENSRVQVLD